MPESLPEPRPHLSLNRRHLLIATGAVLAIASFGGYMAVNASDKPEANQAGPTIPESSAERVSNKELLAGAANALLGAGEHTPSGLRFKSEVQSPHYQTDRDVGASGIGSGLLLMADLQPDNKQWLVAAKKTADWLMATARTDRDGYYWPDYADDGDVSDRAFTSFDDGALGIGDYFWELYTRTHDEQYKKVALSTVRWTMAKAENVGSQSQPVYRWRWDLNDNEVSYQMGMGEGMVGIVHTLTTYYERLKTSDPELAAQCRTYIDGSLRYIQSTRSNLGKHDGDARALPETGVIGADGDTQMNSGYLSGAAGAAYMYLKLHQVFGDAQYLAEADKIFSWLEDTNDGPMVTFKDNTIAWKLAVDPQSDDTGGYATGFEEGSAGIGWTYLQAYKLTGKQHYLDIAKRAGNWLEKVAIRSGNGLSWHEHENPTKAVVHANLNNGSAGIGIFMQELAEASNDQKYTALAHGTLRGLKAAAQHDNKGNIYWKDNDGDSDYAKDMSWHWGNAGIMAFIARMTDNHGNVGGMQQGLPKR